jgi:hypothetical protein
MELSLVSTLFHPPWSIERFWERRASHYFAVCAIGARWKNAADALDLFTITSVRTE